MTFLKKTSGVAIFGLVAAVAFGGAAQAQTTYVNAPVSAPVAAPARACGLFETCASTRIGLGKGDFIVRLSAIGVMPEDTSSRVWLNGSHISGAIKASRQAAPELTFEYFFTDHISADVIAASTRHEIAATGTPLGHLDVGSAWVLPPTVTLAWHFRPHKRFNPYVGVGGTLAFFHNVSPAGGVVQKLNLGVTGGPTVDVGFDYQIVGNWFFNVDAKQMFMRAHAWANDRESGAFIKAHDSLDPTVVGMGIGYRF